jgi:predicted Zn-dependent protease
MKDLFTTTRVAAMVALGMLFGAVQAQAALISEKQELQMGRDAAKQIESKYRVSTDPQMNALVNNIGRRIAAVTPRANLPWQFKVLDTKDINAVSVPGYVYVYRGLIDFVGRDTDAMAGVIGHEIGHTVGRHAVKAAEEQLKYSLILGVLLRGASAEQLGNIAANLALLGYSRSEENQADLYGVDYMTKAGYDPNGMLRFFIKLQQKEGSGGKGVSKYFENHPPTPDRINRVRQEITRLGVPVRY